MIYQTEKLMTDSKDKLKDETKTALEAAIAELKKRCEDADTIKEKSDALQAKLHEFSRNYVKPTLRQLKKPLSKLVQMLGKRLKSLQLKKRKKTTMLLMLNMRKLTTRNKMFLWGGELNTYGQRFIQHFRN